MSAVEPVAGLKHLERRIKLRKTSSVKQNATRLKSINQSVVSTFFAQRNINGPQDKDHVSHVSAVTAWNFLIGWAFLTSTQQAPGRPARKAEKMSLICRNWIVIEHAKTPMTTKLIGQTGTKERQPKATDRRINSDWAVAARARECINSLGRKSRKWLFISH